MCSVCANVCERRVDPASMKMSGTTLDNVSQKVFWNGPRRDIIEDEDGTFTETGNLSWLTPYYPHLVTPDCVRNQSQTYNDAVVCN